jgi:hypothetical protein
MGRPFGGPGMNVPFGPPGMGGPTKEQIEAFHKKMQERFQQMKAGMAPGKGPQAGPPQGLKHPGLTEIFAHFDKKKNGKLTKDEVPPPVWEHFTKMGAVKDGVVTKESLAAAYKKAQEKAGAGPKKAEPKK